MKEELITFETAKLAKEKGFYIDCRHGFRINEEGDLEFKESWFLHLSDHYEKHLKESNFLYGRPTQALLQKWLREKHNMDTLVIKDDIKEYNYFIWGETRVAFDISDTYEEALEKGLQEALKLIS